MKIEDIEVGRTYEGRKGKPRTVVAKSKGRYGTTEVEYHTGDSSRVRICWAGAFSGWVTTQAAPKLMSLDEALRKAGPDGAVRLHGHTVLFFADDVFTREDVLAVGWEVV